MKKYFYLTIILIVLIFQPSCKNRNSLHGIYTSTEVVYNKKMRLNFISDTKVQLMDNFMAMTADYEIKDNSVILCLTYPEFGQMSAVLIIQEDGSLLDVGGKLYSNDNKDDVVYVKNN